MVKVTLIEEFKTKAKIASELRIQIENAKTYPKRELLKKKLKKNNIEAADILVALDKLAREEADGEQNGTTIKLRRDESSDGVSSISKK